MLENWCVGPTSTLRCIRELRSMARCYEPKVLERMSSHYETKKPLNSGLIQKIIQRCVIFPRVRESLRDHKYIADSRYVNVGLLYLNQVAFSAFDLKVHMDQGQSFVYVTMCTSLLALTPLVRSLTETADLTQLWNEQRESIALLKGSGLRGGPGAFGHIAGGYDVGYYG